MRKIRQYVAIVLVLMLCVNNCAPVYAETYDSFNASEETITVDAGETQDTEDAGEYAETKEENRSDTDFGAAEDAEQSPPLEGETGNGEDFEETPVYYCGKEEHTHTEKCLESLQVKEGKKTYFSSFFTCGKEEHTHNDDCLIDPATVTDESEETPEETEEQETYCGLDEHAHSFACLKKGKLICDITDEDHEHVNTCYEWNIDCGMAEHVHTDECYVVPEENEDIPETDIEDENTGESSGESTEGDPSTEEAMITQEDSGEEVISEEVNPENESVAEESPEETTTEADEPINSADYISKSGVSAADVQGEATESKKAAAEILEEETKLNAKQSAKVAKRIMSAPPLLAAGESEEETVPRQGDGSNIENISAKWITPDTVDNEDPALLYIKPPADDLFDVRLQINYALSGEHNYEPGDITITVPAYIFHNRSGANYGNMIIPFPEDPSKKGDFNWTLIDGNYVLTNTRKMSAATKGYIQFAIDDLKPHELVDMEETDPFSANIEVVTHLGNLIALRSNEITAQVDTEAKVTSATKEVFGHIERIPASRIPEAQRIPGETEYIRVNWYTCCYISANTVYNLKLEDTIPDEYNGFIVGATDDTGRSLEKSLYMGCRPGRSEYFSVYTAYPASQFQPDTDYTFHNNVKYTLTEVDPEKGDDPQLQTEKEASAQIVYRWSEPKWIAPQGHFMVVKNGNDDSDGTNSSTDKRNTTRNVRSQSNERTDNHLWKTGKPESGWFGIYPSGLNELGDGSDVRLSYTIDSVGYIMPWTYDPVEPVTDKSSRILSNYFRKDLTITTEDTGFSFIRNGTKLSPGTDYEYVSVEIPYAPWIYKGTPKNINPDGSWVALTAGDGTFEYERDDDPANIPDVKLQIFRNNEWEDYATASWTSGSLVVTFEGGGTQTDTIINLPADTKNFRTVVTTHVAAIDYDIRPVVKLKPTAALVAEVNEAFRLYKTPEMSVWNSVNMMAVMTETNEEIVSIDNDGFDKMMGYTTDISVVPAKTSETSLRDADFENNNIAVHYTAKVEERSVIHERKTYDEAIAEGRLPHETHGIWRDLLPKGMTADLSTVKLREDDKITELYTIENYKNTGRTLLVVEADLSVSPVRYSTGSMYYWEDVPTISFDGLYNFDAWYDYGSNIHNVISFESSNNIIGTIDDYKGEPDDPSAGNNISSAEAFEDEREKSAMTNLNPDRDTPSFVYAGTYTNVDVISAARTSLWKEVMVNNDGIFDSGVYNMNSPIMTVYEGGQYQYRMRMMSNADTISKDLILYDSLENFYAGQGNDSIDIDAPRWQGTLKSVDVSQLEEMGCAPVVYYSTVENLQLSDETNPDAANTVNVNLANSSIWVKADDYTGNIEDVKAVAVDASKKTDGTDFQLSPLQSVVVLFNMHAPYGDPAREYISQKGIWGESAHAYNNAYLLCTSIDKDTMEADSDNFVRKDYTKVGLEEYNLNVTKVWDDDNNRDGIRPDSVTVHLFANGEDTGKNVSLTETEPTGIFDRLPYTDEHGEKIHYSMKEDAVEGYTSNVIVDGKNYTVTNKHVPEMISISGNKTWVGDEGLEDERPSSIRINLFNGDTLMKAAVVRPDKDGNWSFEFTNLYKYENGQPINYRTEEAVSKDLQPYIPSHSEDPEDPYGIVNTYHPYGNLLVKKDVTNTTSVSKETTFPFTFAFSKMEEKQEIPVFDEFDYDIIDAEDHVVSSGKIATNGTLEIKGGQRILVKELPQKTIYKVSEELKDGFTQTSSSGGEGTIVPNTTAEAAFINNYSATGQLNLIAEKVLNNRKLGKYQFKYDLYQITGEEGSEVETILRSASNQAPKSIDYTDDERTTVIRSKADVRFGAVRYTEKDAGKTYRYKLKERNDGKSGYTYDTTEYDITVTVTDNGDGTLNVVSTYKKGEDDTETLNFTNSYKAEGSIVLRAWKDLQGRRLNADEFDFELLDEDKHVIDTKSNTADGSIVFDALEYDEKDIGKIYHYLVREKSGSDDTINYDGSVYGYAVEVLDNGNGTLSFSQGNATPVYGPAPNPNAVRYAVSLYGIGVDVDENGDTMGLTFGPALGFDYTSSYKSHEATGTTDSGNDHRCIHGDDWATIVSWNNTDPEVYEQCIAKKCTHSVELNLDNTTTLKNPEFDPSYTTGDGPASLYQELLFKSGSTTVYENLRWHPHNNMPNDSSDNGTNYNGWGATRIRAMLNGAELTDIDGDGIATDTGDDSSQVNGDKYASSASSDVNKSASVYTETNCLFNAFPDELKAAIGAKAVKYDSVYNSNTEANLKTSYDKLWLLSPNEIWTTKQNANTYFTHPLEGTQYPYFAAKSNMGGSTTSQYGTKAYSRSSNTSNSSSERTFWLRSSSSNNNGHAMCVYTSGRVYGYRAYDYIGVSPGFALSANAGLPEPKITGWETEDAPLPVFVNTLKPGELTLTKNTVVNTSASPDPDQEFHFIIRVEGVEDGFTINPEKELTLNPSVAVSFDFNGGAVGADDTGYTVTYTLNNAGEYEADREIEEPEKTGHTFTGWYTETEGGTEYSPGYVPNDDITVYAHYTPNPYTVTFNLNGGQYNGSTANVTRQVLYGNTVPELDSSALSCSGKTFDKWYTDSACTQAYNFSSPVEEDITLYAKWKEPPVKYAVSLYGIGVDTDENGDTMGLTFGPALGANYVSSYKSHTATGTTDSGNDHRCIHDDDWATIVSWNNTDPDVYEQCIAEGCTHSVELSLDNTTTLKNPEFDPSYTTGDGPASLYQELLFTSGSTTIYENLRWHPHNNMPNNSSNYGTNYNGWGATRIRAILNGAELTDIDGDGIATDTGDDSNQVNGDKYASSASSDVNKSASVYTETNCLFNAFPDELKAAIGAKAVKYDSVYNSKTEANLKTSYDKLWLLSPNEIWTTTQNTSTYYTHPLEGTQYPYFAAKSNMGGSTTSQDGTKAYSRSSNTSNSSSARAFWLRSSSSGISYYALYVYASGGVNNNYAYRNYGVSPGFSLSRAA